MSEWKEYKLGDLIDVKHGYAFKGEFISSEPNNNILVTPGNFNIGGGYKNDKIKYYKGEYPKNYILKEDDVVVTMTDLSQETDTLGFSAKIPKQNGVRYLHNQRIGLVDFISKDADENFIYWLMRTKDYQGFIIGSASGTSIMHTAPSRIKEYCFLLPPLNEQKQIASILSSLDDKIDLLHRQNKTLQQLAETLFRQWFVIEADETWEEKKLSELLTITSSKRIFYSEYVSSGIPFYRSKEIIELRNTGATDSELYISNERFDEINKKFGSPKEGDILMTSVGTLGVAFRVRKSDKFYFKDGNLTWFKDFNQLPSSIIYLWLISKIGQEELASITIGSTQEALTIEGLKSISFKIPPQDKVKQYEQEFDSIIKKIEFNQAQILTLTTLRDTLLPKLMSGEVRVEMN